MLITDKNTGERIIDGEAVYLTIRTEKQIEALKAKKQKETELNLKQQQEDEEKYEIIPMKIFYMGNIEEIKLIMKELDVYERAFLFSVAPYMGYDDCCIKYPNGKELKVEQIAEISGMSIRKAQDVIQSLIGKDILCKNKNSKNIQYFVNPLIFCKKRRANKVLRTMFKNYEIRTMNNVKWKDLKE